MLENDTCIEFRRDIKTLTQWNNCQNISTKSLTKSTCFENVHVPQDLRQQLGPRRVHHGAQGRVQNDEDVGASHRLSHDSIHHPSSAHRTCVFCV